ncbi:unnamed protein product [Closterium sp. Naga37s-1]|nr:unnamed protein product [Closterium sp. Naga37s-1]
MDQRRNTQVRPSPALRAARPLPRPLPPSPALPRPPPPSLADATIACPRPSRCSRPRGAPHSLPPTAPCRPHDVTRQRTSSSPHPLLAAPPPGRTPLSSHHTPPLRPHTVQHVSRGAGRRAQLVRFLDSSDERPLNRGEAVGQARVAEERPL